MNKIMTLMINCYLLSTFSWAAEVQGIDRNMTPIEFNQALKDNPFLQSLRKNFPLTDYEKHIVEEGLEYEHSSGGGVENRPIQDFKGDTLFVGGGKKGGFSESHPETGHNIGLTNIEFILSEIERVRNYPFNPKTGQKFDEAERQQQIQDLKDKVNSILDTYYTVNLDESVDPDFVASITNPSDMSKIPNHRFQNVVFENVDINVWFNPNIHTTPHF